MPSLQDDVCTFAREILEARTGELITVTYRPDVVNRSIPAVEELWQSESHRYLSVTDCRWLSTDCSSSASTSAASADPPA